MIVTFLDPCRSFEKGIDRGGGLERFGLEPIMEDTEVTACDMLNYWSAITILCGVYWGVLGLGAVCYAFGCA